MKSVRQLLRQPQKSVIGIALMTLAAAIVCLCVGQALAAHTTKETLNQRFSTVAIPLVQEEMDGGVTEDSFQLNEEMLAWLEKTAVEHPDILKQVARHGILSAYIPELTPLNITQEQYVPTNVTWEDCEYYDYQESPYAMPYSCAMLVITLDEVNMKQIDAYFSVENLTAEDFDSQSDYYEWLYLNEETEKVIVPSCYQVELTGTVTQVLSLADSYRNPVGRTARLTVTAPTLEEVEALNLVEGEQYIVYGMDYSDEHWKMIGGLNYNGKYDHLDLEHYDPTLFSYLTDWEKHFNEQKAEQLPDQFGHLQYIVAEYDGVLLTYEQTLQINAITMTLDMPVSQVTYVPIRDEQTGKLLEVLPKTEVTYTDKNGQTVTISNEEYTRRYQIPTIARLEGGVEEFLNSEEGARWKAALSRDAVNNQVFAVIGVDRMDYLADFSLERSQIVEGRDFTAEEQASGARVCIIHESLAQANGLKVGDTITTNFYTTDYGLPYQQLYTDGKCLLNPSASFYFDTTPFVEIAEYTIVGIWRGEKLWPDVARVSEYAFSPNTIFVPKSSAQTSMETSNSVVMNTIVPQNGQIETFHELTVRSGYAGRFKYNDQGYSSIAANFHNYELLARQLLTVGTVIYTVLLLLYLLLYPGAQKNNVRTMQSFGAGFIRRFGHIMASSLAIVIPASALGGWVGTLLWDRMVLALQTTAESSVTLQIEPGTLAAVAAAQLIFALVLNICVAIFIAAPKGMSARR